MFSAPVITVDTTARLEAKIVQRIKDRVSDNFPNLIMEFYMDPVI